MQRNGFSPYIFWGPFFPSVVKEPRVFYDGFNRKLYSTDAPWNDVINGHIRSGRSIQRALRLYQEMQMLESSLQMDGHAYVSLLKGCAVHRDLRSCLQVHSEVARTGHLINPFIGRALVDAYVKCGCLIKAQDAFDRLLHKGPVAWTTLMAGYAEHGKAEEALLLYEKMQLDRVPLDAHAYVCILKVHSSLKDLGKAEDIHAEIERLGMASENLYVASALVDLYAKCGSMGKAQEVFDRCLNQNVVLWNALISGYVEHGCHEEALEKYEQMCLNRVSPSANSYGFILQSCSSTGAVYDGQEIHVEIERRGLLKKDNIIGNILVNMYATWGALLVAQEVFDGLPMKDDVAWTVLLSGYVQHGHHFKAVEGFNRMQCEGVVPTAVTYLCILRACGNGRTTFRGHEMHARVETCILLREDDAISRALVSMYSKRGAFSLAQQEFDKLSVRDVVSWTALIVGCVEHNLGQKALDFYEMMQCQGVFPNVITFIYLFKACGLTGAIRKAEEVCVEVEWQGLLKTDLEVGNAVVDVYAKCGLISKAQEVFYKLPKRDSVSYGTLMGGFVEYGNGEDALSCFDEMQREGITPSATTYACVVKACGAIGAWERGVKTHLEIEKGGFRETNTIIGNVLVDMYSKFGLLVVAQHVFNRLPIRDVVAWNVLIGGYAVGQANSEIIISLVKQMQQESLEPDIVTFGFMLSGCGRIGLFGYKSTRYDIMSKEYGMVASSDHYVQMIGIFGRLGQLDMAVAILKRIPICATPVLWRAMLVACHSWGHLELGLHAFNNAVHLNRKL